MNNVKNHKKEDIIFKEFWRDNGRFADVFNGVLFGGNQILSADMLHEMDTDVSGIVDLKEASESLLRTRDIIKKSAFGIDFILMGLESQKHIHYAMPLRNMLYDALGYQKEYNSLAKKNKRFRTRDEFLSKMRKEDRLHPIFTLTIYYGETPWDGPFSLSDMMTDIPGDMQHMFSDYTINILEIRESGKYIFHNKDVIAAFDFTRMVYEGRTREALKKYSHEDLNREVKNFIGTVTDIGKLLENQNGQEDENMCEALDRWIKEETETAKNLGIQEGMALGLERGIQRGMERGLAHGMKRGMKRGMEQGIKQGINQGIKQGEGNERRKIIETMLKNGAAREMITKLTGYTEEEIDKAVPR